MRHFLALGIPVVSLFFVLACPPSPTKSVVDASDANKVGDDGVIVPPSNDRCAVMCQHLRDVKCPEGFGYDAGGSCEAVCTHSVSSNVFDIKPECVIDAGTIPAIQACKTIACKQ